MTQIRSLPETIPSPRYVWGTRRLRDINLKVGGVLGRIVGLEDGVSRSKNQNRGWMLIAQRLDLSGQRVFCMTPRY